MLLPWENILSSISRGSGQIWAPQAKIFTFQNLFRTISKGKMVIWEISWKWSKYPHEKIPPLLSRLRSPKGEVFLLDTTRIHVSLDHENTSTKIERAKMLQWLLCDYSLSSAFLFYKKHTKTTFWINSVQWLLCDYSAFYCSFCDLTSRGFVYSIWVVWS